MWIPYLSLVAAVIGLVVYAVSNNPKANEIGRLMFACGLLAFLLGGFARLPLH
jgi:Na+/phosphate symporter